MQKSQSLAVEDVEPFIPGNRFKGALAAEAGDHQHAQPVHVRGRDDDVVEARREQRHFVLLQVLLG